MIQKIGRPLYGGDFETESGLSLPFVLPAETVSVDTARPGVGLPVFPEIMTPSSARVSPSCLHFGQCGGCQYQHASAGLQIEMKKQILLDVLKPIQSPAFPEPSVHAANPWGYRNRIRLRLEHAGGEMQAGYSVRGSNQFLPVRMCPIADPLLWRAVQAMLSLAQTDATATRWLHAASECEFFGVSAENRPGQSVAPGRLQLQLFLREAFSSGVSDADFTAFCEKLRSVIPELAGAGATIHPEAGRRARRAWSGVAWGAPGLLYPAAGKDYWVSRGAFFQVNRFLIDTLVKLVTEGRSGALAWDLYAGVGLFSRALADGFDRVIAVEGSPTAALDLAKLTRGQPAIQAKEQATLDFLKASLHQRERPDLVVLDPPRAGLGPEGAALLVRLHPEQIVYVSCDPTTLARDLEVLVRSGYRLQSIDLLDLFPQTFHLETVVSLLRVETKQV